MESTDDVEGSIQPKSGWKSTSDGKLIKAEEKMCKLTGLKIARLGERPKYEHSHRRSLHSEESDHLNNTSQGWLYRYKVQILLDQTFGKHDEEKASKKCSCGFMTCGCCPCKSSIPRITKEYIMTYEFGDQNKDTLVMVHGYAGTALNFFRTFKLLEHDYHVYAIDLLGKGGSSRPEFLAKDREEAEEFFIQSFEKWREAVGLTNFTLIGHSMGGYISAKYTLKYPEHVKILFLWSPLGIQPGPENIKSYFKAYMKGGCCKSLQFGIFKSYVRAHCNHNNFLRCLGSGIMKRVIKKSIKKFLGPMSDDELEDAWEFYYQVTMAKESSEIAITRLMQFYIIPYTPILNELDKFKQLGIEVVFAYGDKDWLDTQFNGQKISDQLKEAGQTVDIISKSEHNLYMFNYQELILKLNYRLERLLNKNAG